ncbi:MAG: hypothetical protein ABH817_01385 [archaeon]
MKYLIFDSSSIITLALNDLLYILEPLKKKFKGEFLIPYSVQEELIDNPIKTKRFMLEALMIKKLILNNTLKVYPRNPELVKKEKQFLEIANHTFFSHKTPIELIHKGESACLALYSLLDGEKSLVIDERTTRVLCEAPDNLRKLMESRLHKKIHPERKNYEFFKGINIIRSCELALIALKKKIIDLPATQKEVIRAILYAEKFKGCSISEKEILSLNSI